VQRLVQDRLNQGRKLTVEQPRILKAEADATGHASAGCGKERNMVRGKMSKGRKSSVWEAGIPIKIDETSVQAHKSRVVPTIAPCVCTIHKRDLNEADRTDKIVKAVSIR